MSALGPRIAAAIISIPVPRRRAPKAMNAVRQITQLQPRPYVGITRPALTVATIVERDGRFLLIEEETRHGLRLNQPAGHVEAGESIVSAAARETLEEAAWRVDPTALVGIYQWQSPDSGSTFVRFTFAATPRRHEAHRALDTGILRALWLSYDEIVMRRDLHRNPLVLQSIDDYRAGTRWPLGVIANL
jgi:8-oxo-dGTP pyrophosphatase MutT (NUDIX family)